MIARNYRFHGYNALNFVYKQGRTARNPVCLLRYVPNPKQTRCRVAVVVSKKVDKSAVVRNRIRRRLYAAIESRVGELPTYDLVFTVLDNRIATLDEKHIKDTINKLLQVLPLAPVDK